MDISGNMKNLLNWTGYLTRSALLTREISWSITFEIDFTFPNIHVLFCIKSVHEMKIKFVLFERTLEMIKELHL